MQQRVDRGHQRWAEEMEQVVARVKQARMAALEQARDLAALSTVLMRREKGLGETEHAGVKSETIERTLEQARTLRDALEECCALEQIERPMVTDRDALVEGRCVDADGQGVAGCSVFLADALGNRLRDLSPAKTETPGHFGLVVGEEKLRELTEEEKGGRRFRLVVESADGDTIYDHPESLELEPGARVSLGIVSVSG